MQTIQRYREIKHMQVHSKYIAVLMTQLTRVNVTSNDLQLRDKVYDVLFNEIAIAHIGIKGYIQIIMIY